MSRRSASKFRICPAWHAARGRPRNQSGEPARPMVVTSLVRAERTSVTRHFTAAAPLRYLVACIVAGALAVAGCSAGTGPQPHGGGSAQVALKFQGKGDAGGPRQAKTLTPDPARGRPAAAGAARAGLLQVQENPFAPVGKGLNCPMPVRGNKQNQGT